MEVQETDQLRPINCKFNILTRPHGSVLLCQGETSVVAGIYGPVEAKPNKLLIDKASVEVYFRPKSGLPGIGDKYHEGIIRSTCESVLVAALYPRSSVLIIIQEMQNAGGLLSCSVNAACLALLEAGIAMKFLVGGVYCALDSNGTVHLDPGHLVAENAKATFDFVFDNNKGNIIASSTTGSYTEEEYETALHKCRIGSTYIFTFYKDVMSKNYKTS